MKKMVTVACGLSCFDIAKYFLTQIDEDAEDFITNLKLQKLSYYAQGFYLAINDKPLFPEAIEAWQHGPVIPDLYHKYKNYGSNPIPIPEDIDFTLFSAEVRELLDEVYCVYGQFSPWKLRDMTHSEDPWINAYQTGDSVISHASMATFFKNQLADH